MLMPDLNVLLYAYDSLSPNHNAAANWWTTAVNNRAETIGLPWSVITGFIRLTTSGRGVQNPLTHSQARQIVSTWLAQPNVLIVHPQDAHLDTLFDCMRHISGRDKVSDAHIAAMALENNATVVTHDRDFGNIPELHWHDPI